MRRAAQTNLGLLLLQILMLLLLLLLPLLLEATYLVIALLARHVVAM